MKFSSNLLIEKHGINQVRIENSNLIHSNHKRKQIKLPKRDNKVYKVDFIFNTDSWVDNRIGYCEMIFNAAIMTIVSVDESSAPDNFKLIIQSSAIDPTITEEVNETTPGPDYEFDERRSSFVINLVIGITIPAFLIIVGIVIYFVFLRFRNNDSDDQNNQLIPNEGQEN
ncbi:hypothetical protein TRFO_09448 [Tritrichomonas foetus]|uniref:Uncharacterized protein n=1 Tax=Tritrichomonas foetus TaxID=1144522 RepID=A0A1J4JIS5_9EUKA|nr:hypothetical protein TRFO_09448 [Tritrichomonas foetus]|eukprot:OHS97445.1 hypothetical protein TRFO_09448 [Tritrichomonas foetus]